MEGNTVVKKSLAVLMVFFLAACATAGSAVDMVYQEGNNFIRLTQERCSLPELAAQEASVQSPIYDAVVHIGGRSYKACYVHKNGVVFVIDEEGDAYGPFDEKVFKPQIRT